MTWLAVRALLRRIPGIAWVITGSVIVAAAALFFTYHAGDRHGALAVHRHALADSIDKEVIVHHLAIEQTDRARTETDNKRALARFATRTADSSRAVREKLRDEVEPLLKDAPLPLVQLVHMDDQQFRRDAAATETYLAVDTALVNERLVSLSERTLAAQLDTSRQHQAVIGTDPPRTHHRLAFVAGAVVAIAGAVLLHTVVR